MFVFLQAPKQCQKGGTFRVHSDSHKNVALIQHSVWCLRHKHCRPSTLFLTCFLIPGIPIETSNFGASVTKLIHITAIDCRQYSKAYINNNKIIRYAIREGTEAWEDGLARDGESERRTQGGPTTCDRGQVQVRTRFALNENKASYLPAVRRRVWTCVREHRPSSG